MNYVGLETLTMDPCGLTKQAYAEARASWLCTGCCVPKPDVRNLDAILQEPPADKPLNFIGGCGLSVVYKPFLDRLPAHLIERDLYLGRVYNIDGSLIDDWVTYRGKRRLIIRGTKEAGYRTCTDCGRHVYFAMGKKYLYPKPPDDVTIFERAGGGGFIIPQDLFTQLDLGKWRKLSIDKLPVLDVPTDGLGELSHA